MSIKFKGVSYVYAPKTPYQYKALDDVYVDIPEQKIVAIIGETGSGKSTLIQHINGLLIPTKGEVEVNNFILRPTKKKIRNINDLRKQVGLVFQFPEYQLFEETVERDIMFGPLNFGASKDEARVLAKTMLQLVGLEESYLTRSPFDLSGGQKRRVAIAGILALQGHTLILDEPTAGLDPDGEKEILNLFYDLNKREQKTIILVTHNMNHVLQVADEVIVLHDTKVTMKDIPSNVFRDEKLLLETGIEPPQVYSFLYELEKNGFDTTGINVRDTDELITSLTEILKKR